MLFRRLFDSTVGLKVIMGVTGAALFGFVFIHMVGNLQLFAGAEVLNRYAVMLRTSEELLWAFRLGLLAMVVLHVFAAVKLTALNRAARPVGYAGAIAPVDASVASRTMIISGLVVFAFIVFHILHFTTRDIFPEYKTYQTMEVEHHGKPAHDVYRMVVESFQIPWVSLGYIVCVGLLAWHLSHGVMSMFRSMGLCTSAHAGWQKLAATGFSWIIFLGMSAVPASILLGLVK
jgi:succinate dehydrogenase / fumarate reductase cytochrome b subunit